MFDLIITDACIVTVDPEMRVIKKGAIGITDGTIRAIGSVDEIGRNAATVIGATDRIIIPGLINMHCHAADSLFRGLVEGLPLEPWLQTVWKAERATLSAENCFLGAKLGLAELLKSGVTTVMDMFWHPGETIRAAKLLGMRIATGGIFFDFPGMDGIGPEERAGIAEALFDTHAGDPFVFAGTLPHAAYTASPDVLKTAYDIARGRGGFFHTHAAETRAEQATITERYGRRVIAHLNHAGVLGPSTLLAHCVQLDDEEIRLIAETGAHVVHNPMSNLKLASGFAPVPAMLQAGINVTLGTDGAISGNDLDMWLAMRLAATLHKAVTGDATAVTARQVLEMATTNGAKMLGATDHIGSIEIGKQADLALISTDRLHAAPMFDPINHLIFSAGRADITDVFIAGHQLVKDGKITTLDEQALIGEVRGLEAAIAETIA